MEAKEAWENMTKLSAEPVPVAKAPPVALNQIGGVQLPGTVSPGVQPRVPAAVSQPQVPAAVPQPQVPATARQLAPAQAKKTDWWGDISKTFSSMPAWQRALLVGTGTGVGGSLLSSLFGGGGGDRSRGGGGGMSLSSLLLPLLAGGGYYASTLGGKKKPAPVAKPAPKPPIAGGGRSGASGGF